MAKSDVSRIHAVTRAVIDATEWRETLQDCADEVVIFGDIAAGKSRDSSRHGWEGEIAVPKDIAVEMLSWLEKRARAELDGGDQTVGSR